MSGKKEGNEIKKRDEKEQLSKKKKRRNIIIEKGVKLEIKIVLRKERETKL